MRRVVIAIQCDICDEQFTEETEGSNSVGLIVYGEQREMDVCDQCIHGTFIQEARPVSNRKKRKKAKVGEHPCHCGKTFSTDRGLRAHQTRQAHD